MKKIITKYYCDVCKKETNNEEIDIQVIFTTEQNEGRCCYPHLCNEKLIDFTYEDLANMFKERVISSQTILDMIEWKYKIKKN